MGARPSSYKQGGGWDGKIVEITGYEFNVGDPVLITKGERKGETFTPLSLTLQLLADGATESTPKFLRIGEATDFGDVSEDGLTLGTPEGQQLRAFCDAAVFITSLVHPENGDGFPEERLSDDDTEINFEPIIGTRFEVAEVANEWAKENGKKQKNKKTGKEYEIRDFKVAKIIELPAVAGKPAAKTAAKPALVKGKSKPAPVEEEAEGYTEAQLTAASEALCRYIAKAPGKVLKVDQVRMKVATDPVFKKDTDLRDAVASICDDPEQLAGLDGVSFDAKKKTLKIAA